jgi:hypothetical protein
MREYLGNGSGIGKWERMGYDTVRNSHRGIDKEGIGNRVFSFLLF